MKLIKINAIWCMSCILMNETLKAVEKEYAINYETITYDYDIDTNEVEGYNVGTILPVYILSDDEKEIARSVGEQTKEELIKFFSENGALK